MTFIEPDKEKEDVMKDFLVKVKLITPKLGKYDANCDKCIFRGNTKMCDKYLKKCNFIKAFVF